MVAAEIDEDVTAALPPLILGFSVSSTCFAVLTSFPLFSSPKAIALQQSLCTFYLEGI
jgi:hypothetical protein